MKRKIGNSNLEIVPFALGGNVFGWTANESTSLEILDAYTEAGFNFIDTADSYSAWVPGNKGGESETIIGKWLKKSGKRNQVILSTKVGSALSPTQKGLKKEYILAEAEASLKRLSTDCIDIYFSHYDDLSTPIEETLEAYAQLIQQGKVRYIGTSNMTADRIRQSLNVAKENNLPEYICLQPQYNLYDRSNYETQYQPLVKETGLGVISYYSLASGFLTGKYKSVEDIRSSKRKDQLENYMNDRGNRILKALQQQADNYKATPAQIALAWILARPTITAPIASVSKREQLDILKCVEIQLSPESINALNEASQYN